MAEGKVLVVMGSDSDFPVMDGCFKMRKKFGVEFEADVASAHRTPERAHELAATAEEKGFKVIIAAAGLAAHLAGVLAANTTLPVIGIPCKSAVLDGMDALLATVMMPSGVPVATVAIDGGKNAAILACQILALSDKKLSDALKEYKKSLASSVAERDARLKQKIADMDK